MVGFPCNQFGGQEPGTAEEIETFCSTTYGVTFPMFEKIEVNGPDRHPIYDELTAVADAEGHDGDIRWNFEKFLVETPDPPPQLRSPPAGLGLRWLLAEDEIDDDPSEAAKGIEARRGTGAGVHRGRAASPPRRLSRHR